MSHFVRPIWFRLIFTYGALIVAMVFLSTKGLPLVLIGAIWPASVALGMQRGMRRAQPEAWQRKFNKSTSILAYAILFSGIFFPAIIALCVGQLATALALSVIIISGFVVTNRLCEVAFGPVRSPNNQ